MTAGGPSPREGGVRGKDGDGMIEVLWPKLKDTEWEVNILEEARYQQK